MDLKTLHIYRSGYSKENYKLEGTIEFASEFGEIKIKLSPEHIQGVLSVVAEGLVAASQAVAQRLTTEVIEHAQLVLAAPQDGT